ncbi:glutamate-5-semialdehyde dehydrogenase [Pseudobacillus badius]|uniref:glutamate-5-semialdehyde dehydrogenase n=1 Tax=Bacillus badius TaxID=1455 RepID=UPI001CBD2BA9|nr:glutamate-5-semialdehyde dehydrogenase [Bacillus badius]UAT32220.1 glutamate-5-semialdehyde dehydrogenase [Bacillus badius]GLY11042.1 gamma-glutamyl phosphate reductase [Bacillus badius]
MGELLEKAKLLKAASYQMAMLTEKEKNLALEQIADALLSNIDFILEENSQDMEAGAAAGFAPPLLDRLQLTEERIRQMADGVRQLIELTDPVGETTEKWTLENGLNIQTVRVPLGVIGMVYEARPNVTVDAAALCLKAGNAVLLRGSSSAARSNLALAKVMKAALQTSPLPEAALQLLEDTSRETATEMFRLNDYLDVLIPRGGAGLIQTVIKQATVPVLETGVGNCHIYIDDSAKKDMAIAIAENAKLQRPSVCNAAETLLIHKDWPHRRALLQSLFDKGVELRGSADLTAECSFMKQAADEDWHTEYLAPILAVKTVENIEDAILHIQTYGTKHSEAIVSENSEQVKMFFRAIDAAVLYHNASTRFTDGEQFGYGAEIGISTQKLHARGPMGLRALTTVKSLVEGTGQIRH